MREILEMEIKGFWGIDWNFKNELTLFQIVYAKNLFSHQKNGDIIW